MIGSITVWSGSDFLRRTDPGVQNDLRGLLVATITLPTDFTLRAVSATEAWGFMELATGEIVIGAAELPTELR